MCKPSQKRRFLAVYRRKFQALSRYIDPKSAEDAAIKTAERIVCINREEIFT
jgi:hypothetical protein